MFLNLPDPFIRLTGRPHGKQMVPPLSSSQRGQSLSVQRRSQWELSPWTTTRWEEIPRLERKKKEHTKGRTNRRMPICNPTIQLVIVDQYTKYEVSILNGCGDIFDDNYEITEGRTEGRTEPRTDVNQYTPPPPLFQSGGIKSFKWHFFSSKTTTV